MELQRLARPGRRGVRALREAMKQRGLVQAPTASVLESRILRLLRQWGITPAGVEVVVGEGRYRVDVMLCAGLALEVDGYAFHWSPEAKAADSRRRNRLALQGVRVVEADWVTVMRRPEQLREEVESAMRQVGDHPEPARRSRAAGE
jgi:very-short-patch-repair endonuclease